MADWKAWCRGRSDISIEGNVVTVRLGGDRAHRVEVDRTADGWALRARIASGAALNRLDEPELFVWERNRTSQLVGFRITNHDRLIGEAWIPDEGLTADEFNLYVHTVAAECDRLEALLTGEDQE